jgi:CyaY protein
MLEDQEFQSRAEASLTALYEQLGRASDEFDFDVEMNSGALTVEFEEPRERFVVSPNAPVRQIWVSAHVHSFKLDWDEPRAAFVLPATGQSLDELIAGAIRERLPDFQL